MTNRVAAIAEKSDKTNPLHQFDVGPMALS